MMVVVEVVEVVTVVVEVVASSRSHVSPAVAGAQTTGCG